MSQTRYCSTCGTLLSEGAVICGECGARYQASPYERRATDAPGAWSQAPTPRSRDLASEAAPAEDEGIELITREALEPKNPSATTLRSREQYDQMMVTQPPMQQNDPGSAPGAPSGPGSASGAPSARPAEPQLAPPLDGCAPASAVKRLLAALIDGVIATLVLVPQIVGWVLLATAEQIGTLPLVLIGVGVALPLAYALLMIWLVGAKGFTLGKLIMGLRVTRGSEGGRLGFLRSAGRWVLYGLVWPVMALSIFLDPNRTLRGFHDRIVDSVVVDLKAGRDPMKPRPDDFERAGADHYLGDPSVAVSAHENLLTEPGAAWKDSSAPAQSSADTGWGAPQASPSYAPSGSGASAVSAAEAPAAGAAWGSAPTEDPAAPQQSTGGWAPPPVDPIPSQQQAWGQPQSAPEAPQQWGQPQSAPEAPQQQAWGQPQSAPEAPQQQAWGQPQSAPEAPQAQAWGPPEPAAQQSSWGQPPTQPEATPWDGAAAQQAPEAQPQQDAAQSWGPPVSDPAPYGQAPAPHGQDAVGAPSDLTGDAWDVEGHEVDEQTRLTAAEEPLGDLEQTRISAVQLPPVPKLRLTTDDGTERVVEKAVVVGRNPSAQGEEVLFVMKDDTRSVSKTHLRIDGTGEDVTVTDLGSTNGSSILREDGSRESLVPDTPTVLPAGAQVTLGDRTVSVEKVQ